MSLKIKRVITTLLNIKEGVMRPSYMAVMYMYDLAGKGRAHNSHDISYAVGEPIELTRVTISRLHKQGYLERVDINLHMPTDKWYSLLDSIETEAKKLRIS